MLAHAIYTLAAIAIGFGLGRIKNSTKLAAISTELKNAEATATADVSALITKIKAHL